MTATILMRLLQPKGYGPLSHLRHWLRPTILVACRKPPQPRSAARAMLRVGARRGPLSLGRSMRRREFITLLGGAAVGWPLTASAQQVKPVVGLLAGGTAKAYAPLLSAFLQGLNETGYAEGRSVAIEQRWADGNYQRLPALADDLVQRQVSVLVALTTPAAVVAKAATATIPVVFTTIGDPVQLGLVSSLSRPGSNVTGATHLNVELSPKLLETIREAVPAATSVALIVNPTNPNAETVANGMRSAAGTLGISLQRL